MTRRPARHRVAILVRDGLIPMEMGIAHRLFSQAEDARGAELYDVVTCTLRPGEVRTDADVTVNVGRGPEEMSRSDTVVVVASDEDYDQRERTLTGDLAGAMSLLHDTTRVASICTGSFVLAAAGLLDGLRATTHWRSADRFRELFPAVHLDPEVLYTDEGRVLTSAGVASGIDLCLHMIRNDHGARAANHVARGTIVQPHRAGGQAQFVERPVVEVDEATTARSRAWAAARLDRPLTLSDLARVEAMSVRTFSRRFKAETGLSAGQWLADRRIERARSLLEETRASIEEVARACGFGNAESLRHHFHTRVGVTPTSYRATFRGQTEHDRRAGGRRERRKHRGRAAVTE